MNRRTVGAAALIISVAVGGYSAGAMSQQPSTSLAQLVCTPAPVRLTVAGDSISSWAPPFAGNKNLSWVFTATSNSTPLVGGWARPGANIATIEANLTAAPSEVFLMMVGTNDLPIMSHGKPATPLAQRFAAMDRMVAKMSPARIVISTVPPFGWNYAESQLWNQQLRDYAASRGFEFIDPWLGARDPNGAWWPGTDYGDRVHPSASTAGYIGNWIGDAIDALT